MNTQKPLIALVFCAILIALSFALSYVRIPGTTIALDSLPALFGALLLTPRHGAAIGALGHLFTAMLGGFPYTLPVHLITAAMMALCVFLFGLLYQRLSGKRPVTASIIAGGVAVAVNGPVAVLALSPLLLGMMGGWPGLIAFLWLLTAAAAVNVVIAFAVYIPLAKRLPGAMRGFDATTAAAVSATPGSAADATAGGATGHTA